MKWQIVPIKKAADVVSGFGFSREEQGKISEEFPFFKVNDMNQPGNEVEMHNATNTVSAEVLANLGAKTFPPGTIIFPKIGAAIATGKKRILVNQATFDNNVMGLVPSKLIESRYLYYWSLTFDFQRIANIGPVPSLRKSTVENISIPLSPLSEQRRIIEILDEADHLCRLRVEADKKAERILPALFNKMFGDPAANPMGWPEMPLRNIILKVEAGWSAVSESRECTQGEFGVLKVSAVTSGRFLACENKTVLDLQPGRELITPRRGDLIFSRANTRELVAASCVVEDDHPNLFLPDKLWRLVLHPKRATAMYLKELFWHKGFRDKFRASASGSSGSMLNISQEAMLNTIAPIPPFELQEEFSAKAWDLAAIARQRRQASDFLDSLWANLLQRAFSGTLTAAWREAHMRELLAEIEQQTKDLN